MKPKFIFIIVLVLLYFAPSSVQSQIIDSALGYFPLHNGNRWEYFYHWAAITNGDTYTITVEGDTLMTNGKVYKKMVKRQIPNNLIQSSSFIRIDSLQAKLYTYNIDSVGNEYFLDSLRLTIGSNSRRYGRLMRIDTIRLFEITTTERYFGAYVGGSSYSVAYGIGLISASSGEFIDIPYYTTLLYTQINGNEYGTFVNVKKDEPSQPNDFSLEQNYPNPFNPSTTIRYSLKKACFISLKVYNILGQELRTIISDQQFAGRYEILFDARELPSGVYFYKLQTDNQTDIKAMVLIK
jgi:Secretion system C-terminal sorting domain